MEVEGRVRRRRQVRDASTCHGPHTVSTYRGVTVDEERKKQEKDYYWLGCNEKLICLI